MFQVAWIINDSDEFDVMMCLIYDDSKLYQQFFFFFVENFECYQSLWTTYSLKQTLKIELKNLKVGDIS